KAGWTRNAAPGRRQSRRTRGARACTARGAASGSPASRQAPVRRRPGGSRSSPSPPDDVTAAEAEPAHAHVVEPGLPPERELLGAAFHERNPVGEPGRLDPPPRARQHLRALVEADDAAAVLPDELDRDRGRSGGHVEDGALRPAIHPRDEELPPARILSER